MRILITVILLVFCSSSFSQSLAPYYISESKEYCFSESQTHDLIRHIEEGKHMRLLNAEYVKKVQLLEKKIEGLEQQKQMLITVHDTIVQIVELQDKVTNRVHVENEVLGKTNFELQIKNRNKTALIVVMGIFEAITLGLLISK